MRVFKLNKIEENRPTILLLNGGGQRPYNKFHKATRLFKPYNCNLIALELPGHGKSSFDHIVTVEEMVGKFSEELVELCTEYEKVGLFGFSLGGLLALKATELQISSFMFTIVAGAAIKINDKQENIMQKYTTVEFFEKMRWGKIMQDYHENWQNLMDSIAPMLRTGSDLFVDPSSIPDTPIHLVLGDNDEVADFKLHKPIAQDNSQVNLHLLNNASHFDYFTRAWDQMQNTMSKILDNYLEAKN